MNEAVKVQRLVQNVGKLEKQVKKLRPSRYKSGMLRYMWSMNNSVRRLQSVTTR